MIKQLTPTHLILILFLVYYVVMEQLKYYNATHPNTENVQQKKEFQQLQNKIHYYEIQELKKHTDIDNATLTELDSLESVRQSQI